MYFDSCECYLLSVLYIHHGCSLFLFYLPIFLLSDYRVESITCEACYGYNYTAWSYFFLKQEVLTALNVCGDAGNDAFAGKAGGCIRYVFFYLTLQLYRKGMSTAV